MRLGEYQELVCVKKVDFGIYLSTSSASEERVLLPAKQIPDGVKQGDKLKVFVYKDCYDKRAKADTWRFISAYCQGGD